jgi:hypothetical protein
MHDEHDRDPISERLAALADQINAEHEACDAAMRDGLRHALKAGELLTEAKGRVGHGLWGDWLGLNFKGSERTARAYMQAAREFAALPDAKRQRVAEMPYRDVLKVLAEGERQGERVPVADQNADRRTATEAVAGANDVTPESARRDLVAEVDAVRNATEREGERREEKGEPFPVEEREEYARKLAEMRKHSRARGREGGSGSSGGEPHAPTPGKRNSGTASARGNEHQFNPSPATTATARGSTAPG